MKMILVAAGGESAISLGYHLEPLGFTVEHHSDPVGVIENLDDIDPQAILYHAGDFPRHWKPLLKLAREKKPREELIFLLIAPKDFPQEDAWKAAHLGVNGILGEDLASRQQLYQLEEIDSRAPTLFDHQRQPAVGRVECLDRPIESHGDGVQRLQSCIECGGIRADIPP